MLRKLGKPLLESLTSGPSAASPKIERTIGLLDQLARRSTVAWSDLKSRL